MTHTIQAKWAPHSELHGIQIFKRKAGTGTSGGNWKANACTFKTLRHAQADLDYWHRVHSGQHVASYGEHFAAFDIGTL